MANNIQIISLFLILFFAPMLSTALRLHPESAAVDCTHYEVVEEQERTMELEKCDTPEAASYASTLEMVIGHKLVTASVTFIGILSLVLISLCLKRRYKQVPLDGDLEINSNYGDIEMTEIQQAQNFPENGGRSQVQSLFGSKEINCEFKHNTITNHFTINIC